MGRVWWPRWTALVLVALTVGACQPGVPVPVVKPTLLPSPLAASPTPDPFSVPPDLPILSLVTASGERVPGTLGGWSWGGAAVLVEVQPEPGRFDPVDPGEPIVLEVTGALPHRLWLTLGQDSAYGPEVASTILTPASPTLSWDAALAPGTYVLVAQAIWPNGDDVSYSLGITVEGSADPGVPAPPALYLVVGDAEEVEGQVGTYCWTSDPDASGQAQGLCVDVFWPPPHEAFMPLPSGEIRLRFAHTPPATVTLSLYDAAGLASDRSAESVAEVAFEQFAEPVAWSPEAPPGDYVLVVQAWWPDRGNDAMYSFGVSLP
jgi:hypothetical protein